MKKCKIVAFLSFLLVISSCSRTRIIDKGVNNQASISENISQEMNSTNSENVIGSEGGMVGLIEGEYEQILRQGTGELYPCQYVEVYYETIQDYKTIGANSLENSLITESGGMNVGSYALDASSIYPNYAYLSSYKIELLIKCVSGDVLGKELTLNGAAIEIYNSFINRPSYSKLESIKNQKVVLVSEDLLKSTKGQLAFKLLVAKLIYPSLFSNININDAFEKIIGKGNYYFYLGSW